MSVAEFVSQDVGIELLPSEERPTVLIAEDQPKMLQRLVEQFLELGIIPQVATSGPEAIRIAGQIHPDLVVLDGLLPEMHGFEIARFIRHLDRDYRPRIAIVTGVYKALRYKNEAKIQFGVDDYLVKPVSTEQLAGVVTRARKVSQ